MLVARYRPSPAQGPSLGTMPLPIAHPAIQMSTAMHFRAGRGRRRRHPARIASGYRSAARIQRDDPPLEAEGYHDRRPIRLTLAVMPCALVVRLTVSRTFPHGLLGLSCPDAQHEPASGTLLSGPLAAMIAFSASDDCPHCNPIPVSLYLDPISSTVGRRGRQLVHYNRSPRSWSSLLASRFL